MRPLWSFAVRSYYARPNVTPPDIHPAYHSFTSIGLADNTAGPMEGQPNAVAYFHWGVWCPAPTLAGNTLHLHYPLSAFAGVLALLASPGPVQCFWYRTASPARARAGIEHVRFVPRP